VADDLGRHGPVLGEPARKTAREQQRLVVAVAAQHPRSGERGLRGLVVDEHDRVLVTDAELAHEHRELGRTDHRAVRIEQPPRDVELHRAGDVRTAEGVRRARHLRPLASTHPAGAVRKLHEPGLVFRRDGSKPDTAPVVAHGGGRGPDVENSQPLRAEPFGEPAGADHADDARLLRVDGAGYDIHYSRRYVHYSGNQVHGMPIDHGPARPASILMKSQQLF